MILQWKDQDKRKMKTKLPSIFNFLFHDYSYKIIYGGRDSAKTTSAIIALLLKGRKEKKKILCCREIQKSIGDSIKASLDKWIKELGYEWFYTSTNSSIIGLNGTEFIF